jgi:sugar fermentation stimulation protein A
MSSRFHPDVRFPPALGATFQARPNRFLVRVVVGGRRRWAACRDPGRLGELLRPGARVRVEPAPRGPRKTRLTLTLVRHGPLWVPLVPALANRVLAAALARGGVPGLEGAHVLGAEIAHGRSRFDFLLGHGGRELLAEVKSVTLVEASRALFPDAPTVRGARHVRELAQRARRGAAAAVVFVVQRPDARCVAPNRATDPLFADALAEADRAGVRLLAYTCRVAARGIRLDSRIPVVLG